LLLLCNTLLGCTDGADPDESAVEDAVNDAAEPAIDARAKPATIHTAPATSSI